MNIRVSSYIYLICTFIYTDIKFSKIYLVFIELFKKINAYRILVGEPEGRRPLGRPRRRWVDNIEMYLRDIGWHGLH
jgi:hypothetical protein